MQRSGYETAALCPETPGAEYASQAPPSSTFLLPVMSSVSTAKGPHPLLVKYLAQLAAHPLRTKAITTGTLCFLQEVLGSNIAGTPVRVSKDASPLARLLASAHVDAKALKMAIYGFLVSAPLSHFLIGLLQKAFAGRTSARDKIAQIIASNLLISPIQTSCEYYISLFFS